MPYITKQHILLTLFAASLPFNTFSAPTEPLDHFISMSLEDLVSLETTIATTSKRTTTQAPAVVTLITEDDIKATGATNLADILQTVPGIHIRYHHFINRPLVHFRGAKANQTLLMINGNTMRDLVWNLGLFWKGVPASTIERIEIIRGPGSALFGADAAAGVVNVITKTAGRIQRSEAGIRTGSFNTTSAWMQHGDHFKGFEIAVTAEVSSTDGHSPYILADGQTLTDSSLSLAPDNADYGWKNTDLRFSAAIEHWRLQADYTQRSDVEIGLTGFGVLDPVTMGEDSRFNLDLFYNNDNYSEHWSLATELRYQHLDYTSGAGFQERPPGYTDTSGTYPDGLINQNSAAERHLAFNLNGVYHGINNHAIRVGAGHKIQDLYSVEHLVNFGVDADGNDIPAGSTLVDISDSEHAFAPEKQRNITHFFIEDVWQLTPFWELTAGARYDDYSDFGDTVNPRLALVWQTTDKLTSKLIYGRAFRAPNYNELFAVTSRSLPNSELEPERSETLDIAFSYSASNSLLFNINLFYFDQTDLIDRDSDRQYQNIGDHTIRGIELETRWQANETLAFVFNFTARNQDDSSFRFNPEAEEEAYLRFDWGFRKNWNLNFQTNWIGERERTLIDTREPLDDFSVTDTTIRYASSDDWEFAASIRNLFDEDAREYTGRSIPDDLPLPERNAYIEARYKF